MIWFLVVFAGCIITFYTLSDAFLSEGLLGTQSIIDQSKDSMSLHFLVESQKKSDFSIFLIKTLWSKKVDIRRAPSPMKYRHFAIVVTFQWCLELCASLNQCDQKSRFSGIIVKKTRNWWQSIMARKKENCVANWLEKNYCSSQSMSDVIDLTYSSCLQSGELAEQGEDQEEWAWAAHGGLEGQGGAGGLL